MDSYLIQPSSNSLVQNIICLSIHYFKLNVYVLHGGAMGQLIFKTPALCVRKLILE